MAEETHVAKSPTENGRRTEQAPCGVCYRPNVDILENDEELTVLADVPGAEPEGIDVHFEDGTLRLYAKVAPRHQGVEMLGREYGVGDFSRAFEVNEDIEADNIAAEYADGVLTIHLKKKQAPVPKRIEVKVK